MAEYSAKWFVSLVFGVGALVAAAAMVPYALDYLGNATSSLQTFGVGGMIGSLILSLLVGIVIGVGIAKLLGKVFDIEIGV